MLHSGVEKNRGGRPTTAASQASFVLMDLLITMDETIAAKRASIRAQIDELRAYEYRREQIRALNACTGKVAA
jgi:hypothetical protein